MGKEYNLQYDVGFVLIDQKHYSELYVDESCSESDLPFPWNQT